MADPDPVTDPQTEQLARAALLQAAGLILQAVAEMSRGVAPLPPLPEEVVESERLPSPAEGLVGAAEFQGEEALRVVVALLEAARARNPPA